MKELFGPGWLREEIKKAVERKRQIEHSHRCRCFMRDPDADDIQPGLAQSQSQQ